MPVGDPVVTEVANVAAEWTEILVEKFKNREMDTYGKLRDVVLELTKIRREMLTSTLSSTHIEQLKARVTTKIDAGNRELKLDMIPRAANGEVPPPPPPPPPPPKKAPKKRLDPTRAHALAIVLKSAWKVPLETGSQFWEGGVRELIRARA